MDGGESDREDAAPGATRRSAKSVNGPSPHARRMGIRSFFACPIIPPPHETEPPAVFFRCDSAPFPTDAPDPIDESGDRTAEQQ